MFGNYNLFSKSDTIANQLEAESSPHIMFLKRLYQQSKQVSQIIAYIWRWGNEEQEEYSEQRAVAEELKTYFEHPDLGGRNDASHLKKLFGADPRTGNPSFPDPAYLLRQVFPETLDNEQYIFPIFNKFELGEGEAGLGYAFEVTVDAFIGEIIDADKNNPDLYKMIVPYPPRPELGNVTLTKENLDDWLINRKEDEFFAKNPYIPTTCS